MSTILSFFSGDRSRTLLSQKIFDTGMPLPSQRWRLFIDKKRQTENGSLVFDLEEPGYFKAMSNAFEKLRDDLGKRYRASDIVQLHDVCVQDVSYSDKAQGKMVKGLFGGSYYPIYHEISESAKREWEESSLILDSENLKGASKSSYVCTCERISPRSRCFEIRKYWRYCSETEMIKLIEEHGLNKYYDEMSRAKTRDEELAAIVRVCRTLEVIHVFQDGNQRTIAFALLTKLLLENGFSPVILNDPAMFDGYYGVQELVAEVKKGFDNFRASEAAPSPFPDRLLRFPKKSDVNHQLRNLLVASFAIATIALILFRISS